MEVRAGTVDSGSPIIGRVARRFTFDFNRYRSELCSSLFSLNACYYLATDEFVKNDWLSWLACVTGPKTV